MLAPVLLIFQKVIPLELNLFSDCTWNQSITSENTSFMTSTGSPVSFSTGSTSVLEISGIIYPKFFKSKSDSLIRSFVELYTALYSAVTGDSVVVFFQDIHSKRITKNYIIQSVKMSHSEGFSPIQVLTVAGKVEINISMTETISI